jgi:hypothetical protein
MTDSRSLDPSIVGSAARGRRLARRRCANRTWGRWQTTNRNWSLKDAIEHRITKAARKPTKGDPASIAKELRVHCDDAPVAPTLRRFKTNDSTIEKLGELLRENPAGILVSRDELVGLIATWDREGREGDRTFFLEAWKAIRALIRTGSAAGILRSPTFACRSSGASSLTS